jgi:hypothetical protein
MIARFKPTELRVDVSNLSPGDRQALPKLIEAARVFNDIFLTQMWSANHALYAKLRGDASALGKTRLDYFWLNKSPWSDIDGHEAFLPNVPPKKLPGANFYPEDMTREEFETWVKTLSKPEREQAEGFFTVIHRDANRKLRAVPYSQEYRADLEKSAKLLEQAAGLTDNVTLKKFLTTRAAAFRSNDYYESDIAWMDLDAPIDITIGPYETYNDDIFGYKAAFEVYVNLRDDAETAKLKFFADHLQEVENNLPIDPKYRNPKLGSQAPIRVVNEIFDAGDAAHAVQTAAYNLPAVVGADDLRGLARPAGQLCVVQSQQELVAVDPPRQLGIEEVTAVAVQDGLGTVSQPVKGVAQAVERDVEVVAGGVMAVVGPLQFHQHVAASGPVLVDQQVLEHRPGFQAVPFRDSPPGHVYLERPKRPGRYVSHGGRHNRLGEPVYGQRGQRCGLLACGWFCCFRGSSRVRAPAEDLTKAVS